MKNLYYLDYTKEHYTENNYFDAKLIPFKGSNDITPFFLSSTVSDLENIKVSFKLLFKNYKERTYLSNDKDWPVFSKLLHSLLMDFQVNYNYFDVQLFMKNEKNPVEDIYYAYQIPKMTDLIDREKSEYVEHYILPNTFSAIKNLVFNEEKNIPSLFRIQEYPKVLLLKEDLALSILEKNMPGLIVDKLDKLYVNIE